MTWPVRELGVEGSGKESQVQNGSVNSALMTSAAKRKRTFVRGSGLHSFQLEAGLHHPPGEATGGTDGGLPHAAPGSEHVCGAPVTVPTRPATG